MDVNRGDADLRRAYQDLRRQDEASGRPFPERGDLLRMDRRRERSHRPWRLRLALAALSCLLVVAALTLPRFLAPRRSSVAGSTEVQVSAWRAPTDWLLHSSDSQLLQTVPHLTASAVGGDAGFSKEN